MNKNILITFILLSLFRCTSLLFQAQAQTTSFGLSLSPPVKYIIVPSGTTLTTSVVIKNTASAPQTVTLDVLEFTPDSLTGQPVLGKLAPSSLVKITNPPNEELTLQPGESSTVYVALTAPLGKQQREYHWTVVATAKHLDVSPGGGIGAVVTGGLASNLIVFFGEPPTEKSQLSIDTVSIPLTIDSLQALDFSFSLKNTGPQAIAATGSATIKNVWFNDQVTTLPLYPDMVLAGSSRPARTTDASPLRIKKPFLFGIYAISVTLDETTQESILIGRTLAFPWSFIIIAVIGWVFIILIKKLPLKKILNYILPKPKETSTLE